MKDLKEFFLYIWCEWTGHQYKPYKIYSDVEFWECQRCKWFHMNEIER